MTIGPTDETYSNASSEGQTDRPTCASTRLRQFGRETVEREPLPSLLLLRELHRHPKLTEEEEVPFFIPVGCTLLRAHSVQSATLRPIRRIVGALLCFQRPISVADPWWLEWSELRERVHIFSFIQLKQESGFSTHV